MATIYSSLYAEAAADNDSWGYKGPLGSKSGETYTVIGTVTIPGTLATNDIANLFPLPAGAKITRYSHWYEDHGGTCTATIQAGTTDMKASIALGTAVTQANQTSLSDAELGAGNAEAASAAKTINIEYTSVATPTANAVYSFVATIALP